MMLSFCMYILVDLGSLLDYELENLPIYAGVTLATSLFWDLFAFHTFGCTCVDWLAFLLIGGR